MSTGRLVLSFISPADKLMFSGSRSGVRRTRCARIAALQRISRYYLTGVDQVLESARPARRCRRRRRLTYRNDTDDKAAEIIGGILTGPHGSPAGPSRNARQIISNLERFSSLSTRCSRVTHEDGCLVKTVEGYFLSSTAC